MPDTLIWVFFSIVIIEATLVCLGNAFTIFVFWRQRASLKKACCLLVNLAIADLLVGASTLVRVAGKPSPKHQPLFLGDISSVFFCLFTTVSVLCLLVISLERAYAVLWPLRHRVARTRTYIIGIAFAWIGGLNSAILNISLIHGSVSFKSALSTIISLLFQ
ncbi:PREDICTED: apelin receptor B-like [Acropora digitifera]|uniref:apelin receptor B-like n=1 Tax=Acropora digitifera TaxID=70779 RepID=UPI00077AF4AC|nr:PREDICTED: apelin receptor B-like [Acropora digitifera]